MKWTALLLGLSLLVTSCGSTKKERMVEDEENEDIEREFVVKNASSKYRPGWIEDAEVWAKGHDIDTGTFRYFSFETEPKVGRGVACNIAKANVRADIAAEISTFIDKQFASVVEGNSSIDENNPDVKALKEYVENSLVEKVKSLIHGASVVKTYWEKRKYEEDRGAKRDFTAWTCAVFVRMKSDRLDKSVNDAAALVMERAKNENLKDKLNQSLARASENFKKSQKGKL